MKKNPLTTTEAQQYAREFERMSPSDYHGGHSGPGARRGRPSLAGGISPKVQARVSPALYSLLDRKAKAKGITQSEALRLAIKKL